MTGARRRQQAAAGEVIIVFATDWYIETNEVLRENVRPNPYQVEPGDVVCQVVPSGPGFPDETNLRLFNSLIYAAQRRLSITSPSFVLQ